MRLAAVRRDRSAAQVDRSSSALAGTAIPAVLWCTLLLFFAATAHAVPLRGDIAFGGTGTTTPDGEPLSVATGLAFDGPAVVTNSTVDFATFVTPFADTAVFADFTFNPFGGPVNLWSVGNFNFTLQTVSIDFQGTDTVSGKEVLSLSGSGVVTGNGFSATPGAWLLNATASSNGTTFVFSTNTASVPAAGTLPLLGIGLVGLGAVLRRRPKRASLVR